MLNIHDYITNRRYFKTFKVDDLLFVEYKCMIKDDRIAYWTHNNYFCYILSGQSKYISGKNEYVVHQGDAMFLRKGTYVAESHGGGDYCALLIFVSDDFIKKVADKYPATSSSMPEHITSAGKTNSIFPLNLDESLSAYFHSVLSYFPGDVAPSGELLKIKFEELLLNIFTGEHNRSVSACLRGIRESGKVSLRDVMESSFIYPMSLEEYARLCARSLSTFKSDFYDIYKTSPGKWLISARLQYAKILVETTECSVNDIASKSGFRNTTHFVKIFKKAYGMPPLQHRLREASTSAVKRMAAA